MTALADLTCAALTTAYRRGELSPVDVARDCLARIDASAAINAFLPIEPAGALQAATELQARWRLGNPGGPIDGVPASIKDNIWAIGLPTRRGSKTSDPAPAAEDFPGGGAAARTGRGRPRQDLLPEFGWIGACHSPLTGITRNPWNLDRTTGGSSGGAAAAALLNLGSLHLGTDGAGSIRIPSAFTGVFGIKPSFGRVPAYPASPFTVLRIRGLSRGAVADAALMLCVIAEPDARDMTAWNTRGAGFPHRSRGRRARACASPGPAFRLREGTRSRGRSGRRKGRARLAPSIGAIVEEADPGFARTDRDDPRHLGRVSSTGHRRRGAPRRIAPKMDPGFLGRRGRTGAIRSRDYRRRDTARADLPMPWRVSTSATIYC